MEVSVGDIQKILVLLGRVDLKGNEAIEFIRLAQLLKDLAGQDPQEPQEPQEVQGFSVDD